MTCSKPLGVNETLEHFPVGRRIAFDAAKGRLWVVCPHCRQWNLTPLEERWEAIEDAERLYRGTKLRMSTANVGLARMPDGMDLIRVGAPLRPELAAWRYGAQFARRRMSAVASGGLALAGVGALALALPAAIAPAVLLTLTAGAGVVSLALASTGTNSARLFTDRFVRDDEGQYLRITNNELPSVRLVGDGAQWGIRIPYTARRPTLRNEWFDYINKGSLSEALVHGPQAIAAARTLLPLVNGSGAKKTVVADAVGMLDQWGDASHGFADAATHVHEWAAKQSFGDTGALAFLPAPVRLGLEMIAHEEQEQRALAGELEELERAWRDAEEIAGIADDLLVPGNVSRAFNRLRAKGPTPP